MNVHVVAYAVSVNDTRMSDDPNNVYYANQICITAPRAEIACAYLNLSQMIVTQ